MTTTPPLDLATTTPVVPVSPAAGDSDDGDPDAYARVTMEGVPDVQGAQPGTPVQVGGTFSRSFRATAVLEVEADGRSYRATLAPAQSGRWSATVRVYHPGVLRLHATLVVTRTDNDNEALAEDSQQTTVSLARTTVDLAVTSPSGRLVVGMGGLGSGIVARTAVGFGPRRVAWSLDGSPGTAGTAHQDSADPGRFTDQLTVPPNPLGTRTLRARCTPVDTAGREIDPRLATEATTTFTVADGSAPTLDITIPRPYQPYLAPGGTASIDLEGAAGDPQSGVARVEYSVDGAGWTTLGTADGFAHWRTSGVPVSGLGEHTVRIRAVDREPRPAGDTTGTTVRDVPVRLLSDYRPASLAERLDRRGYLGALLGFAYEHLRRADGSAVTIADLEVIGCQSLGALSQALPATAGAAAEPVPRVQAAVEVLRRFLGAGLVAGRWDPRGFADDEIPDLAGSSPIVVAAPTTVAPGRDGRPALVLDGTSGVTVPGNPNLRLGDRGADFTVAFWFRLDQGATGQWRTVLRQGDADLHRTPGIYLSPGGNSLHVRVTTTAAPNEGIDASTPLTVGRWTHVVVVKAGLDLLLYLDGSIDRRARLSAPTTAFDGPLFIGDDPWQQPTACAFDSVELLRFAAPENLVLALARSGDDWARHGDPVAQQRAALAHQRSTAYDAMLAALGTSYAELRLARAATAEVRERLADRLGVLLAGATPDPLTQLTLTASQRTDAALELLLGITDTDPARPQPRPQPLPALHRWRVEALTATWSEQDRARTDPRLPVLVDPDVIAEADLTPAGRTSIVVALLQARRQQLDGLTAELRQLRSGAATPGDGMTALLARAYPGLDVVALEQERASGHDIGGALAQHDLTAGAFAVLVTATRLAAAGSIEEDDWTEVQDIAVTSLKQALYPTWRSQENDVVLSPDTFRASDSSAAGGWRHPPGRREAWERVLLVRVSQRSGVEAVLREALDAAEPPALATLRDELLASVEGPSAVGAVGDWLAARLGIDVLAGAGGAATSRLTVAAEFVSNLLASVRAGRLAGWHPAGGWTVVDETRFDQGWVWLSGYRAWVAATLAYLYPENLLRPELLPMPTAGFGELVSALRGGAATADQARVLANELLAPLRGALDAALPPPRAAWTFTSGGATDSSSSGVALTYGGGARPSSGLVGPAVTFNGVDGRLDVPRGTALDSIVDDFTLAFWARPAAARSDSGATSDLAGTVGQRFALGPAQGAETFGSTGDSIAGAGVSVGINGVGVFEHSDTYLREVVGWRGRLDGWTQVTVVYQGRRPRIHVNGKRVAEAANPSAWQTVHATPRRLGSTLSGGAAPTTFGPYSGQLSDVRIYAGTLSDDQVAALAFVLTERRTTAELRSLRRLEAALFSAYPPAARRTAPQAEALRELCYHAPLLLARTLASSGEFAAAGDWLQNVYAPSLPPDERAVYPVLADERNVAPVISFAGDWTRTLNPHTVAATRPNPDVRFTLMTHADVLIQQGDALFARGDDEGAGAARTLYEAARSILADPQLALPGPDAGEEVAFANPSLLALAGTADARLGLVRQGRDIAGTVRPPDIPSDPTVGAGAADLLAPTAYRFRTLLDRARQLTNLAESMESQYLGAMEKFENAQFRRLDAENGLALAQESLTLATRREVEAEAGVSTALDQRARVQYLGEAYRDRIEAGLNSYESAMLFDYVDISRLKAVIGGIDAAVQIAAVAGQSADVVKFFSSFGSQQVAAGIQIGAIAARAVAGGFLDAAEARLQANTFLASHARQVDEWWLQVGLAQKDAVVANDQVQAARDHVQVVAQESVIARMQSDQAASVLEFLDRQFLTAELYGWMAEVLGSAYRNLLQQATSTALLAQRQLSFQRQETVPPIIAPQYWQVVGPTPAQGDQTAPDRRGLTGAERLQADLATLDGYAFDTDRRQLNLSQTFSLVDLCPREVMELRRSGRATFATPMAWFDAAFPGHYLRLVKRVRLSLVALVPPSIGIRATLSSVGISRVVTGQAGFPTVVVVNPPEQVALTSPVGATGVFELDLQPDLLLPFEGSGVDTQWMLELPHAANPFDFDSIADVMLTIEYTARSDPAYREQVVRQLARDGVAGERVLSLRQSYPDQWYALLNPVDPTALRTVSIELFAGDFPAGVTDLATTSVSVALRADGALPPMPIDLRLRGVGGAAETVDAIASTAGGSAPEWADLADGLNSPLGEWSITVDPVTGTLLDQEVIRDLLLSIGFRGEAPPWPG